jgi:hypothetical protein
MAESDLGRQVSEAVQSALGPVAGYLALITQNNPVGGADQLLARPDVSAVILDALNEAQTDVEFLVEQAWQAAGSAEDAQYRRLIADVERQFDSLHELRGLVRHAHASVPPRRFTPGVDAPGTNPATEAAAERGRAVQGAVLGWARTAALRARMTVSTTEGAARTAASLQGIRWLQDRGERVFKRWKAHTDSGSTCFWCRRLDGVTIPVHASFASYLGGPVAMPQTTARRVASPAGEERFGLPRGRRIIYTHPPRLYHGDLQGPLLHPFCRCWLEVAREAPRRPAGHPSRTPAGYLAAADIRDLPEETYQAEMAFLRAAVHELGLVLRRLAEGRNG